MKILSVIVIFISFINFGYTFETIEKSINLFELEIVDFEEIEDLDYLDPKESHHSSCKNINMNQEQKHTIIRSLIKLKKQGIDHKAEVKKAKIDYMVSLFHPGTTRETSYAIGTKALNHTNAMKKEAFEFIHKTLFTTLKPDQRKNLVKCLMKMKRKKARRAHRRNGRYGDHYGVIEE